MIPRVVYDAMVFFQWAALPADRTHATIQAVFNGSVRLILSHDLIAELRDLLNRPAIQAKFKSPDPLDIELFLETVSAVSDILPIVNQTFSWKQHPDDDHVFNLAIDAQADFLVTWERRLLQIAELDPQAASELKKLAPQLQIVTPRQLSDYLKSSPSQ